MNESHVLPVQSENPPYLTWLGRACYATALVVGIIAVVSVDLPDRTYQTVQRLVIVLWGLPIAVWTFLDAKHRHRRLSWLYRLCITLGAFWGLPMICVPWHLFRTRGIRRTVVLVGLYPLAMYLPVVVAIGMDLAGKGEP